jgi:hypothetical protein
MRKLTITLLLIIIVIFAAKGRLSCGMQERHAN